MILKILIVSKRLELYLLDVSLNSTVFAYYFAVLIASSYITELNIFIFSCRLYKFILLCRIKHVQ